MSKHKKYGLCYDDCNNVWMDEQDDGEYTLEADYIVVEEKRDILQNNVLRLTEENEKIKKEYETLSVKYDALENKHAELLSKLNTVGLL